MVSTEGFNFSGSNNDFAKVRIGVQGLESQECVEIQNITNISAKMNFEVKEADYYGTAGKVSKKDSKAPSCEVSFAYSQGNEVHEAIARIGWETGTAGMTQFEADTYDGYTVSYIANVELDNWGADGGPRDDENVSVNFSYAGGEITKTKITTDETEN